MGKKFITKKKSRNSIFFKLIIIAIILIFLLSKFMSFKIFEYNHNLVSYFLESSNHLIETDISYKTNLDGIGILISNIDLKKINSLFYSNYLYKKNINESKFKFEGFDKVLFPDIIVTENKFTVNDNLPKVYIYNTHQTEEYVNNNFYNLTPTVYTAAELLKNKLEEKGIMTIVEDGNISQYLNNNNLNYDDSYIASRYYLEQAINKYPSVEIFIDLHRDALTHDAATIQYNGKNYAKILFVVGLDHNNYNENLEFTKEINKMFLENYAFLTRGILEKSGPLVNGIYNQDLSNRIILLEVGGHESNFEEVENTIELVSEIIYKKVGDKNV